MNETNPIVLSAHQKRQATLLYYFSSMEYLDTIIERVRALTAFTDQKLDYVTRVERDKAMREIGWSESHLSANWSTNAHPMLKDCLRALLRQKAMRSTEWYDISGVRSALTGMGYFSINWTLPEEEEKFLELNGEAADAGANLDATVQHTWTDFDMVLSWEKFKHAFPRLPRFRVRTDVSGESGKRPVRTGVYVPQDDPYGTLQFGWTGNADGSLIACETFSDLAREYAMIVGRDKLWQAPNAQARKPDRVEFDDRHFDDWCRTAKNIKFEDWISARNERAFSTRACKWYFVEHIDGEFEDDAPTSEASGDKIRCQPGEIVPRSGWWQSPALGGQQSFRFFEQGAKFPETRTTQWGSVFWYFDPERQE